MSLHHSEILAAASRGNLHRYKSSGGWAYTLNHKRISKAPVVELIRRGFLRPVQQRPSEISQPIEITIQGQGALKR
jgi:hypothetical protein